MADVQTHAPDGAKFVCETCGSERVHEEVKLDPNTGRVLDIDVAYCRACEQETQLVLVWMLP